ncbi:MAG: outer membrane protein assembly factor BamD [Bacteroidetes bacterium]|nr:MAG: outer membrane protein assembly factor BamD [Bacteroidota bacterium]RLD76008.1 MAG: outer membrane protein assembly factor BamD [Bacteroidota bacterium]
MFRRWLFGFVLIGVILTASCSKHSRVMKSGDNELKYEVAVDLYEKGDYYRAIQLFDQLIAIYRGTERLESINYYYANCYYQQDDYLLASYYFKRYAQNYPHNPRAEECMYLNAYCYYLDSPKFSLDQTNTYEAIKELQLFINMFPDSDSIQGCNDIMDELRGKLEKKAIEISIQYYKTKHYKAAITSLENVMSDFPDTENREQILYFMMKSFYFYAIHSVDEKREERYQQTIELYNDIMYLFPETKYQRELKAMHRNATQKLAN